MGAIPSTLRHTIPFLNLHPTLLARKSHCHCPQGTYSPGSSLSPAPSFIFHHCPVTKAGVGRWVCRAAVLLSILPPSFLTHDLDKSVYLQRMGLWEKIRTAMPSLPSKTKGWDESPHRLLVLGLERLPRQGCPECRLLPMEYDPEIPPYGTKHSYQK